MIQVKICGICDPAGAQAAIEAGATTIGTACAAYEMALAHARTRLQGKKLTWLDGVKALFVLIRIRLSTSRGLFGSPDPYHRERLTQLSISLMPGADEQRTRDFS